ncbi:MAG: recombinase family protein [Bacillota bacterium]|nr:recombinase family protein [Bacillota bacterium]
MRSYNAAIYCRLSRDDENNLESESITNQKRMLAKYANERSWKILDYYIDDGYSGTSFNRPEFQRMINDIESKKINLVIAKDLSRLGRDYIQTGYYLEVYFPQKGVRFLAVNDGIDTNCNDNDIAPFRNILNEMYAKDISKKIRTAFRIKAENGEFIGAFAPYGYKKDPKNKNRLIIDEEAANNVRRIFYQAKEGNGLNSIARMLNNEGIVNPTYYKKLKGSNYINNMIIRETKYWTNSTIRKILSNNVYLGIMSQGKQKTESFKCKKKVTNSPKDWIVVEDSHEPIIDREIWDNVQKLLSVRKRSMENGANHIFSGIIKCRDCGRYMSLGRKTNGYQYFVCGTYKNYGSNNCTRHGIGYGNINEVVMNDLKRHMSLLEPCKSNLVSALISAWSSRYNSFNAKTQKEIKTLENRIAEIDLLIKNIYEDKVKGNISQERFLKLSSDFEQEQTKLKNKLGELSLIADTKKESFFKKDYWEDRIDRYFMVADFSESIIRALIERVEIGERKLIDGVFTQEINIQYKFSRRK